MMKASAALIGLVLAGCGSSSTPPRRARYVSGGVNTPTYTLTMGGRSVEVDSFALRSRDVPRRLVDAVAVLQGTVDDVERKHG